MPAYKTFTPEQLQEIITNHHTWLKDRTQGQRADLSSAVLSSADLSSAVLRGADLRGADLSSAVLSSADLSSAVLRGADLRGANLSSADLSSADLSSAVLSSADLRGADLRGAVLSSADLSSAVLRGADLSSAVLSSAVLRGAVLRGAVLRGADLRGADLRGAVLSSADLRGADLSSADLSHAIWRGSSINKATKFSDDAELTGFKNDLWNVLCLSPFEVPGVINALQNGRINGSVYEGKDSQGFCGCLVGTLRHLRQTIEMPEVSIKGDSQRPIERWFFAIEVGDTPETNFFAKKALEWTEEWLSNMRPYLASQTLFLHPTAILPPAESGIEEVVSEE